MSISRLAQPKILLVLICILFLFSRLYKITEIPLSVYWDEASIGYNAYSIARTGQDEWGKFLPIHFRAFGEFKLPVYIYSVVPFVKIFGLNAFSVRLPSVLFSLGVMILTYLLAKKLSGSIQIGLWSSFFISISPWFFIFSRTGYEATAGLMFYILAIYFFLKLNKNIWCILLSVLSFILSTYSYNSFRVIAPLTMLVLVIFNIKSIINWIPAFAGMTRKEMGMTDLKWDLRNGVLSLMLSVVILVLSIIPIYRLYVYDTGASRLQTVGATSASFIKNYLSHFSPDFLIVHGDQNLRSQQSDFGQLYLPDLILLPLGLLYLIRSRSKYGLLILILLLLGPIPAAITRESPHALRSIAMVPFIATISAEGAVYFGQLFKNESPRLKPWYLLNTSFREDRLRRENIHPRLKAWYSVLYDRRNLINFTVVIIFLIFFINYFQNFLNTYPAQSVKDWQYEYKRIYTDYGDKFDKYGRILISDKYAQPYIFTLFYLKYDPDKFRREVVRNSVDQWGFSTVKEFGKFEFGKFPAMVSFNR